MASTNETVTLEVSFPPNWYHEAEAELLWVDSASGAESSYGAITQAAHNEQATFVGHHWRARGKVSRELLGDTVVAVVAPGAPPHQLVAGGAPPQHASPSRAAGWCMGRAAREPLAHAVPTLLRVVCNATQSNDPKFRTLRMANAAVAAVLELPGALALLGAAGFSQEGGALGGEARLVLPAAAARAPLLDASDVLERIQALLRGGSLTRAPESPAPPAPKEKSASHHCAACRRGINNDVRRGWQTAGETWVSGRDNWELEGEYRYHCDTCDIDLCSACYDAWKGEAGSSSSSAEPEVHAASHPFSIVPPRKRAGGGGYGSAPAPPPRRTGASRRGAWG